MSKRKHFEYPATVNPDRDQAITVSSADVDKVHKQFLALKRDGRANENFDREDIHYVGAYLLEPTYPERSTWAKILAGGHVGYSLLKHEAIEIQELLKHNLDPLNPRSLSENPAILRTAHAKAIIAEHEYLLKLAHEGGTRRSLWETWCWRTQTGTARAIDVMCASAWAFFCPHTPGGRLQAEEFYARINGE